MKHPFQLSCRIMPANLSLCNGDRDRDSSSSPTSSPQTLQKNLRKRSKEKLSLPNTGSL